MSQGMPRGKHYALTPVCPIVAPYCGLLAWASCSVPPASVLLVLDLSDVCRERFCFVMRQRCCFKASAAGIPAYGFRTILVYLIIFFNHIDDQTHLHDGDALVNTIKALHVIYNV